MWNKKLFLVSLLLSVAALASGQSFRGSEPVLGKDNQYPGTVWTMIANDKRYSLFYSFARESDTWDILHKNKTGAPVVALVPSNEAIKAKGHEWLMEMQSSKFRMGAFVRMHTVMDMRLDNRYSLNMILDTHLPNVKIAVSRDSDSNDLVHINVGEYVLHNDLVTPRSTLKDNGDRYCANGKILEISGPLDLPLKWNRMQVQSTVGMLLRNDQRFSLFNALVKVAQLTEVLDRVEKFTLLVPSDKSLKAKGEEWFKSLVADEQRLKAFILMHCVEGTRINGWYDWSFATQYTTLLPKQKISVAVGVGKFAWASAVGGNKEEAEQALLSKLDLQAANGKILEVFGVMSLPEGWDNKGSDAPKLTAAAILV